MKAKNPPGLLKASALALLFGTSALFAGLSQASDATQAEAKGDAAVIADAAQAAAPLVPPAKLKMLVQRAERKKKMSNPARFDKPQAAMAFYANKRTGPIYTRGPEATQAARPLDPALYQQALAALRKRSAGSPSMRKALGGTDRQLAAAPGGLLSSWSMLGPDNQGGRTRQLLIHPTNPSIMYTAAVGGGVWKTTDGGANWAQLTDLLLPNIAVVSLAMDPTNPQILYAGTGEGVFNGDAIQGAGIYKSTDGGLTWAAIASTVPPAGVAGNFSYVFNITVSTRSPQRLYASTRTGLFRSNDGGGSWTQLINGSTVNGCHDIAMQVNRSVGYVFAACGTFAQATVYRALDSASSAFAPVLSNINMGRTSLAIAPSNEAYIYAMSSNKASHGVEGVYRSTASGAAGSWTQVLDTSKKLNTLLLTNPVYAYSECVGGAVGNYNQGWYDNVIAVDPVNPNRVWAGGIDLFRSDDGGANWGIASYWWFDKGVDPQYAHADNHVIKFQPGYNGVSNRTMYVASDGGVFRTMDATAAVGTTIDNVCGTPVAGGVAWTELNNQYVTAQFYHGSTYPDGSTYFGGTQDNGTWRGSTASTSWTRLTGGDGGYTAVDAKGDANPSNDVLFAEYTGLSIQRSTNGGASFADAISGISDSGFAFIAPFAMNQTNRQELWTGGWYIWRTTNQGGNWTRASAITPGNGSIAAVATAPTNSNNVIVGMSDGYILFNNAALTSNSSTNWASTRPRTAYVSSVAFDPTDANIAYATYETFTGNSVYKSVNGGASWVAIPGSGLNVLPQVPANTVAVDPTQPTRLYVGTDIGVYTSMDGGANWYPEVTGFGHVSVEHLEINTTGTKRLYAFTHGRGAWRVDLNP